MQRRLRFGTRNLSAVEHHKALDAVELCAGGGGQALGIEAAGFHHQALVEIDPHCCSTLRANRPHWHVVQSDLAEFDGTQFAGLDLLAAGLPCPPFSVAGKQLGARDERNLFPEALRIISQCRPRAIMIENVRGFLDAVFEDYRLQLRRQLHRLGYQSDIRLLNACDFGVPQLRPRVVIVAAMDAVFRRFEWPSPFEQPPPTVGETIYELMASKGWTGAQRWRRQADQIAPTIVGGSKKHGGPDLGPTRARMAWATLGVDGTGLANEPPGPDFSGLMPKLTVEMVARLQGFPPDWTFSGGKTAAYRQVGNAFPPPVAAAVAAQLRQAIALTLSEPIAV